VKLKDVPLGNLNQNAIFITVRSGSTRLPQKALLTIDGEATIEYLIERCKKSQLAEKIVLCTTTLEEDLALVEIAKKHGIDFYQGSVEDKLDRWLKAAHQFDVGCFVTADGDDLFCEPELMDLAFQQMEKTGADFVEGKDIVFGGFSFALRTSALEKACQMKGTSNTEMMWVYFTETGAFKTSELKDVPEIYRRPDIRATLDYKDDFHFFANVIQHFHSVGKKEFNLREIIQYLDQNPSVIQINRYLHQEWLDNQKAKTKLVLK
jgi:spore coat polysaccharide biosynthesis protein SpsF